MEELQHIQRGASPPKPLQTPLGGALAREYLRPWKLLSLAFGIVLLVVGSFYYRAPDWDIPISLIMAVLAYLTAPWSMRLLLERRWKQWPMMLLATWFTVDGSYWIYWHFKDPVALELMRSANFPASLSLYGACGIVWLYRGSLKDLLSDIRRTKAVFVDRVSRD